MALTVALREKADQSLERVFGLLGLLYGSRDINHAYISLRNPKPIVVASSLEFLDNVLSRRIKKELIPVAEGHPLLEREGVQAGIDASAASESLAMLVSSRDSWLRTCATYLKQMEPSPAC
jgi:hypothetical protein